MTLLNLGLALALLTGCTGQAPEDTAPDTGEPPTCAQTEAEFQAESDRIRACDTAAECGQVLTGTSCGCTQNQVARLDADTTEFYRLMAQASEDACDLGLESDCDCPAVRGFACAEGVCGWDYGEPAAIPACRTAEGDPFTLGAVRVEGDTLHAAVSASGGCETHDWSLCWPDGTFAESEPVQARLEILHDSHDDPCDMVVTEDLALDLSPLKSAWINAYGAASGTILLVLGADGAETLSYSF